MFELFIYIERFVFFYALFLSLNIVGFISVVAQSVSSECLVSLPYDSSRYAHIHFVWGTKNNVAMNIQIYIIFPGAHVHELLPVEYLHFKTDLHELHFRFNY